MGTNIYDPRYKRQIRGERFMRMLPLNVVMAARISGPVEIGSLKTALNQLRRRHALLAVRVEEDRDRVAWYRTDGVPEFAVDVIARESDDSWMGTALDQLRTSFPMERGPLVRFALVHSPDRSELVVCGHHVVCDGVSLTYLVRDILLHLADPDREAEVLDPPPPIDETTVPNPPKTNFIVKKFIELANRRWERDDISFGEEDLEKLHRAYWEKNAGARLMAWELGEPETSALAERCRAEKVTVNSALWTAFLAAQRDVQGEGKPYFSRAGMAISLRDRLGTSPGEALGFYASSLMFSLKYRPGAGFWDAARRAHGIIKSSLAKTNLFKMLIAESLSPTIADSLYFQKYGLLDNKISARLLKKMEWDTIALGYAITNVGKIDIPRDYGPRKLESVFGPAVYSDVDEKIVGVVTATGKLSCVMTFNADIVSEEAARQIKELATGSLLKACQGPGDAEL